MEERWNSGPAWGLPGATTVLTAALTALSGLLAARWITERPGR
ncbi:MULTISPECIES: hypothetical protein [unclassified Streptomyces]